jgi:hypothetical protein
VIAEGQGDEETGGFLPGGAHDGIGRTRCKTLAFPNQVGRLTIMSFLQHFVMFLSGFAIAVAGLVWLAKKTFAHFLDRDIEKFKARLEAEASAEIEHLKSQLQRTAYEHQVTFSKLHEKRAEAVETLFSMLLDFTAAVQQFLSPINSIPDQAKKDKTHQQLSELSLYFVRHRIYLSKALCESIAKFIDAVATPARTFRIHTEGEPDNLDDWFNAWQKVQKAVPRLKTELEDEFRRILGGVSDKPVL